MQYYSTIFAILKYNPLKKHTFLIPLLLLSFLFYSQNRTARKLIILGTDTAKLKSISETNTLLFDQKRKKVREMAKINHWPLTTFKDNVYSELIDISVDNIPIYYSTHNYGAAITSRAAKLHSGGSTGLNLNGENMLIGIWDGSTALLNHQLFEGRIKLKDGSSATSLHASHVAGTVIGSGAFQNENSKGMAHKANAECYDWSNDVSEVALAASNGLLLSNHSYGISNSNLPAYAWGKYDSKAQSFDEIMFNAPFYQFVCSAGNSRNDGLNTIKNGYDLLSGQATSKNGITVAAVNEVLDYKDSNSVLMSAFSSWGPTDDGRVKPDISAKGVNVFSASNVSTDSYATVSGTSMASPSIAGTLSLFQQYYYRLNNKYMRAATLKGLMIHTADEAGSSPGPDYRFGWGLINAEKATEIIKKNKTESHIFENILTQNENYTLAVRAINNQPLKATICWTDPKGNLSNTINDDATPNLINNLDLKIAQNSTAFLPWKLDPANVSKAATQGDNNVDNIEKIEINNATNDYIITINHKGNLKNNFQNYSLILSGVTIKDFWLTTSQKTLSGCTNTSQLVYNLKLNTKTGFKEPISFSILNLPSTVTAVFSKASMTSSGDFSLALSNMTTLLPGKYTFKVKAQTSSDSFETELALIIHPTTINKPVLSTPINNSNSVEVSQVLSWISDPNSESYTIQIAKDASFNQIIEEKTVLENKYTATQLSTNTSYFWRVRSNNSCVTGNYSDFFNFETICDSPTTIELKNATETTASFSWISNMNITSWEVQVVSKGQLPLPTGTVIKTNQYTVTGLAKDSCYDLYIKSYCGKSSKTLWIKKQSFCTQPNYCNGEHFFDSGGATGNYLNNENYTQTIYPQKLGERVKAVFNSFKTDFGSDFLTIYNGASSKDPILYYGSGTQLPGTFQSTDATGALTFKFTSNSGFTNEGWDATITCEPLPSCVNQLAEILLKTKTTTTASLEWKDNDLTNSFWEVALVAKGELPVTTAVVTQKKYEATGLKSNTGYDFYIRPKCTLQDSDWSKVFTFNTEANYCDGDHFFDSGGIIGAYNSNENQIITIYPKSTGDRVKAIFNVFELNSNDVFNVYDGINTTAALLFSKKEEGIPTVVRATNPQGALTFSFQSSDLINNGWDATIVCEPLPVCHNKLANIILKEKSTTTATFGWSDLDSNSSWEVAIVAQGLVPSTGTLVNTNQYTATGLTSNTAYDFYVRSKCAASNSEWSKALPFITNIDYCGGDHFYDSGGATADYKSLEYKIYTIYPKTTGDRVKAIFNSFKLNSTDTFTVYNGSTINSEIIYTNNLAAPTILMATNHEGALTFSFRSSAKTNAGWDATIVCEALPSCSSKPSNVYLSTKSTSSATFSWIDNSLATSWEIAIVPQGSLPSTGTTITTNQYTATGLQSNTWFDFYVRSKCATNTSDWSQALTFNTDANYCAGDHFYDAGGPNANYKSYEYSTLTIFPKTVGDRVRAVFNLYKLNANDTFMIYDGTNTLSELLYSNSSIAPTTISASNTQGALTFYFRAASLENAGWDASLFCEPIPACAKKPTGMKLITKSAQTALIDWTDNSLATSWEIAVVPQGSLPQSSTVIATKPYTATGLNPSTAYDLYVRSRCGALNSDWSNLLSITTDIDYCSEKKFYDTGGVNANYSNNESYTSVVFPLNASTKVSAVFKYIDIENCCDLLSVYDGPIPATSNLLYVSTSLKLPNTLVSTHSTGALSFVFKSDGGVSKRGWEATLNCGEIITIANKTTDAISFYPNPVVDFLNIKSPTKIKTIAIFDINRRLLFLENMNPITNKIDLSQLSTGVYFAVFVDEFDVSNELKFIKK